MVISCRQVNIKHLQSSIIRFVLRHSTTVLMAQKHLAFHVLVVTLKHVNTISEPVNIQFIILLLNWHYRSVLCILVIKTIHVHVLGLNSTCTVGTVSGSCPYSGLVVRL